MHPTRRDGSNPPPHTSVLAAIGTTATIGPGTGCPDSATGGTITAANLPCTNGPSGNIAGGTFGTSITAIVTLDGRDAPLMTCGGQVGRAVFVPGAISPSSGLVMYGGDPAGFELLTGGGFLFNINNRIMYLNAIAACCEDCEPLFDPDVRTQGFWKRICAKPHPSGEDQNLPDYVDCVNTTVTFAGVDSVQALCDRLQPNPKNDKCEQAEAQFMALLLNVCSGRVETCNCIDDPELGPATVGEAIDFIDALLSDPARTHADCVVAQSIADSINIGLTLVDCP